jgi:hypothetical protein
MGAYHHYFIVYRLAVEGASRSVRILVDDGITDSVTPGKRILLIVEGNGGRWTEH